MFPSFIKWWLHLRVKLWWLHRLVVVIDMRRSQTVLEENWMLSQLLGHLGEVGAFTDIYQKLANCSLAQSKPQHASKKVLQDMSET